MERELCNPKSHPSDILDKDWSKRKVFYKRGGLEYLNKVHDMQVYEDDVWVVTLPKCGTTWMQELVWLLMNNCDFEAAKAEHLEIRSPFLEFNFIMHGNVDQVLQPVEQLSRPRLIKTHLPLPLLPSQLWSKKPKTIYVFRNLKDALVSEFYHARSLGFEMDKSLDGYIMDYIERSSLTHLPFEHATEFYFLRSQPWVFYTSFEKMKSDLKSVIHDLCKFLNKSISEEQLQQLIKHVSFEEMKNNPKTNHIWEFEQVRQKHKLPYENHNFVRKGQVGGYKDELSSEIVSKIDSWIEKHMALYQQQQPGLNFDDLLLIESNTKTIS